MTQAHESSSGTKWSRPLSSSYTGHRYRAFTLAGQRNIWRNAVRSWTFRGTLRTLWHLFYDGELCDICGRKYDSLLWWCPDGEMFARFTGREWAPPYVGGLYCPRCFDQLARKAGVTLVWQPVPMDQGVWS